MQTVILACQTMKDEIEFVLKESGLDYPVEYLESGLHNYPENLREKIQEKINTINADIILLVFGCCGKGLVGIKSTRAKLIIPRIDDCITLVLGSTENRRSIPEEISTYFITKGWLDPEGNVMWSYLDWVKRYGEQKALRLTKKLLANYTRFTIIDTGAYDIETILPKIQNSCEKFNMQYNIIPGSLRLLRLLVLGRWNSEFIVLDPGQETTTEDFYPALASHA